MRIKGPRMPRGIGNVVNWELEVRDLIDPLSGEWCRVCLHNLFVAEDIDIILRGKPNLRKKDRFV